MSRLAAGVRIPVDGGPADGGSASAAAGSWRWIDVDGRGFSASRPGAGLYLRCRERWEFAGCSAWVCGSCGVLMIVVQGWCAWCGEVREGSIEEVADG